MFRISEECDKLYHILKQYGNVKKVSINQLEFKSGRYKRIIWLDDIFIKDCSVRLTARLSSVYYCVDENNENVLKGGTVTDVEIAVIKNNRVHRVHGLLNIAIEMIATVDHFKIYNIKKLQ